MLWPRHIWWAPFNFKRLALPGECATCGAPRTTTRRLQPRPTTLPQQATSASPRDLPEADGVSSAVELYCSTCRLEHEGQEARGLAFGVGAALFGAVAALAFPLLWPRAQLGWHLLVACSSAFLPIAGLGSWSRRGGGWGSLPRLWPAWGLGAIVERREFAQRLAAQSGRAARSLWLPPIAYRLRWWLVPALALALGLIAYAWHHPRLRVVNLTRERLWLAVDGVLVAAVDPAGVDLARASVVLRLPRGERQLVAFDERHHPIASARARLAGGHDHLYAPASLDRCFWLELTGYGREPSQDVRPLVSRDRFFSLDTDIDTWFAETPEPPVFDRRSTGGTLTGLRQSPCARAPETVRRAASAVGP